MNPLISIEISKCYINIILCHFLASTAALLALRADQLIAGADDTLDLVQHKILTTEHNYANHNRE